MPAKVGYLGKTRKNRPNQIRKPEKTRKIEIRGRELRETDQYCKESEAK